MDEGLGGACTLLAVRHSESDGQVRVVFEFDRLPEYSLAQTRNPSRVVLEFRNTLATSASIVDSAGNGVALQRVRVSMPSCNTTRAVVDLRYPLGEGRALLLNDPPRIVVDIPKRYENSTFTFVAPGIRYLQLERGTPQGPLRVDAVYIDLSHPSISVRPVLAGNGRFGRDTVSAIARRHGALVAINGIYFAPDGRPLGLVILDGRIVAAPQYDRTAVGFTKDGRVLFDRVSMKGHVTRQDGISFPISGINRPRAQSDIVIYTPEWGDSTRTDHSGLEIGVLNDTVVSVGTGDLRIPAEGFVVSIGSGSVVNFAGVRLGDQLKVSLTLSPDWIGMGVRDALGAGPRLVSDGKITVTAQEEHFQADVAAGRAPRTALGVTRDNHLILLAATGRQRDISVGLTLEELAGLMIELGAVDALNLDGGGSSTLAIRGFVVNLPSGGQERKVGDAILVFDDGRPAGHDMSGGN
ncbi:MAG TPA: AMIN domain-containing protein [Firmicutes bacterium]|nr:AMIN domain-containing protein [Bacillota bacterium]